MIDGPTKANNVLVESWFEKLEHYIDSERFTQHDPKVTDRLSALRSELQRTSDEVVAIKYDRLHLLLAEGSYVLAVSEGSLDGTHSSFYDLFRDSGGGS